MAQTKLVIKDYSSNRLDDGSCIIYLRYCYGEQTTYFSTSEKIKPEHWNKKDGIVRKSYKGHTSLNDLLEDFKINIDTIIRAAKKVGGPAEGPTIQYVRNKYSEQKKTVGSATSGTASDFFGFVDQLINYPKKKKSPLTVRNYKLARTYLQDYEKSRKIKLDWFSFNMKFYDDFRLYINKERKCSDNSFGATVKNLKVFLSAALAEKVNPCDDFKSTDFKAIQTAPDTIYLNEDEINVLNSLDLSKDKKLDQVRDLFVLACWSGLRYSDFSKLELKDFTGDCIRVTTHKTKTEVVIPFHPLITAIKEKYQNNVNGLPRVNNQAMNDDLKILGKKAGFTREVLVKTYNGNEVTKEVKQAWELIGTHTARRSYCTNLYKRGFSPIAIMTISGHKTEKNFLKYIRVGLEENADLIKKQYAKFYDEDKKAAENPILLPT